MVTCQNEVPAAEQGSGVPRAQGEAYEREEQKRQEELAERGDRMDNTFGSQIRNHVLYPTR